MTRRTGIATGAVVVLVVAALLVWDVRRPEARCGSTVTSISGSRSTSPFLDAEGRKEQPDADRERAVASLGSAPAPFGPVVGAVGYHYEQWAQLSAFAQGIGVRTRDNPDFTMLEDRTLRPLWSVQVDTKRSTYDADDGTYLVTTLPRTGTPELVALDAATGKRRWCAELGGPHVRADDPLSTQLLDDGGVAVLGPGRAGKERVVRLDRHGHRRWSREVEAERGDFLGVAGDGVLVAGGRPAYQLSDPGARKSRGALVALDLASGRRAWQVNGAAGSADHVLGTDGGLVVVLRRAPGDGASKAGAEELVAYDDHGTVAWTTRPAQAGPLDATLRSGRVLVRQGARWAAYDARAGHPLWRRTMPSSPQLLPYGFELDEVPLLDADHALVGTTTGLRVLDLGTGAFTATAPLPVDGVSTTFWPYQVVVSPHAVAVATNTSAVVLRRR